MSGKQLISYDRLIKMLRPLEKLRSTARDLTFNASLKECLELKIDSSVVGTLFKCHIRQLKTCIQRYVSLMLLNYLS